MRKERAKGRKAYNSGQEAIGERNLIFDVSLLQPSFWDHATDRTSFRWLAGHMGLTKSGKSSHKTMRLVKKKVCA